MQRLVHVHYPPYPPFARGGEISTRRWFRPAPTLVALLILWLGAKAVFAYTVMPQRADRHQPRTTARWLTAWIPWDAVLYLFRLKDETLMFYYGRPVVRLNEPADLPVSESPIYAILTQSEWDAWDPARSAAVVDRAQDSQGDPIVLIRLASAAPR